jgi:hypothetical protein
MTALLLAAVIAGSAPVDVDRMVQAIYQAEGGANTRYRYGIKSVKCATVNEARRVCRNSVVNNIKRWEQAGKPKPFVAFMADRYCPVASDPIGHDRWIKNVTLIYERNAK